MSAETCASCTFYEKHSSLCRRFPPVPVQTLQRNAYDVMFYEIQTHFPYVSWETWCGEYTLRKDTAAND